MYNNNNNYNNQNQQNQVNQPLLNDEQQQYYVQQMNQPQQYPQYQQQQQPQYLQQQQYQQQQQNPNQVQIVQNMPHLNQILTLPTGQVIVNPEIMYCESKISRQKICDEVIGVQGMLVLLQIVLQQYPLRFTSIQIKGKTNILSSSFYEQKIMQPLVTENPQIDQQYIRTGYVGYICQSLSSRAKSFATAILVLFILLIGLMVAFNLVYFNNQYSEIYDVNQMMTVYIVQVVITSINWFTFLFGVFKCQPKAILTSYALSFVNYIYCCIIIILGTATIGPQSVDPYLFNLISCVGGIIFLAIITICHRILYTTMVRLLILLSQIPKETFSYAS